jgi:hypothetical protein
MGVNELRNVLEELVALKDMKEEFRRHGSAISTDGVAEAEYERRRPLAWAAARAALAHPVVAPLTDRQQREWACALITAYLAPTTGAVVLGADVVIALQRGYRIAQEPR